MIYASLYENRFRVLRQNQILASYGAVLQRKPRTVISTPLERKSKMNYTF
jgi:hypothetical protein